MLKIIRVREWIIITVLYTINYNYEFLSVLIKFVEKK